MLRLTSSTRRSRLATTFWVSWIVVSNVVEAFQASAPRSLTRTAEPTAPTAKILLHRRSRSRSRSRSRATLWRRNTAARGNPTENDASPVSLELLEPRKPLDTTTTATSDDTLETSSLPLLDSFSLMNTSETGTTTMAEIKKDDGDSMSGLLWRGVVVVLCALWASNFAAIKLVVAEPGVDSSLFAVARFGVAALALAPFALMRGSRQSIDAETLRGAIVCGGWVAFGYLGQLIGLLTTTASRSCVICSLHCVFVAAIAEFMRSRRTATSQFDVRVLAPAALAVVGVAIVELWGAGGAPSIGDLVSFAQPIGFGLGYLQLEELMSRRPDAALPVSAIKLSIVALASLLYFEIGPLLMTDSTAATATEFALRLPDFSAILASPTAVSGVLWTGLATTALALWIESIAFVRVPATDASIILTTEPLFAALFGAISLGETFGSSDYVGASLIIGACVLATLIETPGDGVECVPDEDTPCEPPRQWPFWGF